MTDLLLLMPKNDMIELYVYFHQVSLDNNAIRFKECIVLCDEKTFRFPSSDIPREYIFVRALRSREGKMLSAMKCLERLKATHGTNIDPTIIGGPSQKEALAMFKEQKFDTIEYVEFFNVDTLNVSLETKFIHAFFGLTEKFYPICKCEDTQTHIHDQQAQDDIVRELLLADGAKLTKAERRILRCK